MVFQGRLGVRPEERSRPQPITVDVEVETDLARAGRTDRLEHTLDYKELHAIARSVVEGEPVQLLETLAARIADRALTLARVRGVRVMVAKQPPLPGTVRSASVHIYRTRARS